MRSDRRLGALRLLTFLTILTPSASLAQTVIAGVVTDQSSSVLPGVTVEARSPALIEQVRTAVTNGEGQYRIVDLRPGEYSVTFSLPGFSTTVRQGLVLESSFTATVDAQMRVGGIEETLTVSGSSPVVDVQSTQLREVISRDLVQALPTGRSYQVLAATLPAVNIGRFDVGGSTQMQTGQATAYGGIAGDFTYSVDGLSINETIGSGGTTGHYMTLGAVDQFVYQVSGGNAESQTGGVQVNVVPKTGGNTFSFDGVWLKSTPALQSSNVSDQQRVVGVRGAPKLAQLYDYEASGGGPIMRSKLWFFSAARGWAFNNEVLNLFHDGKTGPLGAPVVDVNRLRSVSNRLTWQVSPRNKLSVSYERSPKFSQNRNISTGLNRPEATNTSNTPVEYNATAKWTSTLSQKVFVEVGFAPNMYGWVAGYQKSVKSAAEAPPYGDVPKRDVVSGIAYNNAPNQFYYPLVRHYSAASVSYVSGAQALKTGYQLSTGYTKTTTASLNGDMQQLYSSGAPFAVNVYNTPTYAENDIDLDLGLYVQDTFTLKRLTLNPGLRFDRFLGSVPAQSMAAGRFVPARSFPRIPNLPHWADVSPRFGVAYDLRSDGGKTMVIKLFGGKFVQQEATSFQGLYNPSVTVTDQRNWTDTNKDDIAQDDEIGPSRNANFGLLTRRPDPNLKRTYNLLYHVTAEHEFVPGVGVSASYNRREFKRLVYTDNLTYTANDYQLLTVADPRGTGTLPVWQVDPARIGPLNELGVNAPNNRNVYNGVDLLIHGRLRHGAVFSSGISTGRQVSTLCDVENLNSLRFCDQSEYDVPFRTTFKLSGSHPLPWYGFRVSGVFQSTPGASITNTYSVTRTQLPALVSVSSVSVPLNEPGSLYSPRVNQLDLSLTGALTLRKWHLKPQIDVFNVLNANPALTQVTTFGPTLGQPLTILPGRLCRLGFQLGF